MISAFALNVMASHVRLITKGGYNWTDRHPWGVRLRAIRKEKAGQENSG